MNLTCLAYKRASKISQTHSTMNLAWILLVLLLSQQLFSEGFRRFDHLIISHAHYKPTSSMVSEGFSYLQTRSRDLVVPGNNTRTLLNLISLGDAYYEERSSGYYKDPSSSSNIRQNFQRVQGCLSDVRITTAWNEPKKTIYISGIADSRIARGLLALLSQVNSFAFLINTTKQFHINLLL